MHELQIATEIINIVEREMVQRHLDKIGAIGVRLGALSGFDPEALRFSFSAATIDTPLSGTKLDIELVPIWCRCKSCGLESHIDERIFICPSCGSQELEILKGDELEIFYLEI